MLNLRELDFYSSAESGLHHIGMQGFTRVVEVTKGTGGQRDGRQGDREMGDTGTERWETRGQR